MSQQDLFGMREKKQEASGAGLELPEKVYFVGRTSDKEKAGPQIVSSKDGAPFLFKVGVFAIGGDGESVTPKHYGRYAFFSAFLRPNYKDQGGPQNQDEWNTLSGRLVSFINATLSPGIEGDDDAWLNSYDRLAEYAAELNDRAAQPIKPEFFDNPDGTRDNAAYLASVFAALLQESPRTVLVSVVREKRRNDPSKVDTNVLGYRAGTAEEAAKAGKLTIFPSRDGELFEFAPSLATTETGEDF